MGKWIYFTQLNGQTKGFTLNRTQSIFRFHYTYITKYFLIKQEHRKHAFRMLWRIPWQNLSSPLLTHNTLLGLKNTDLTWVKSRSKYLKTKQEFEPVGGEPAVYLRVAGRRGEPETLTESILFQLKARAAWIRSLKSSPNAPLCCLLNGDWLIFTKSCFDYSLKP